MIRAQHASLESGGDTGGDGARMGWRGPHGASRPHRPVMEAEIIEAFTLCAPGSGWIVDATVGAGGHARLLLEALPDVRLIGVDQDPDALELAAETLAEFGGRVKLLRGRMSELCRLLRRERVERPVGFLADLGVSSMQIDRAERGFSFQQDGPLDMRMDPSRDRTAANVINEWDEGDLADLFFYEGDERAARKIARAIVEARRRVPFRRTGALADLIANTVGSRGGGPNRIHPATRVFQALRRAVNEEGDELLAGLACAEHWLQVGGLLAVITFHSGEDRVVKRELTRRDGPWEPLTPKGKPLAAARGEVRDNPRSRSAKLRTARRRASSEEAAS